MLTKGKMTEVSPEEIVKQKQHMEEVSRFFQAAGKAPKAYVECFGCQQNVNDTEKIKGMLQTMGYTFCEDTGEADLILFNTCCVRDNAEKKVFGKIGALKALKEQKPHLQIALCGCMMQQEHVAKRIRQKYPQVTVLFGTHNLHVFPELLLKALRENTRVHQVLDTEGTIAEGLPIVRESKVKAFVTVMYGCNNFCTYCIVPYVRGRERSRKPEDILSEIQTLYDDGVRDFTLLGQNVNSYGKDLEESIDFADLIERIDKLGLKMRLRFMTSHPKDISDKLIDTMAKSECVCEHLHLPLQSGSDRVLRDMNRVYTREKYLGIVKKLREKIPGISLTSDIIVGFPTEDQEAFEETVKVIDEVGYDLLYTFIYSRREGTPAAKMPSTLSDEEIQTNFERLVEVQNKHSLRLNQKLLGTVQELLVEGESRTNPDKLTGRTRTGKLVHFTGDFTLIGQFVKVKITEANTWSLTGEMIEKEN